MRTGTWFATLAGTAIHAVTEAYDLKGLGLHDEPIPTFEEVFLPLLEEEEAKGVEVKASGRTLQKHGKTGGPNKKDRDWWLVEGPKHVERYVEWRELTKWDIPLLPTGEPAVEVAIQAEIGGRPQLGYIDRVFLTPAGELVCVDIKSGATPESEIQLGVYKVGFERTHGMALDKFSYFMSDRGELTLPLKDLAHFTDEYVDRLFEMTWAGIDAGVFLPNVTAMCRGCTVRDFCRAVNGEDAEAIPLVDNLVPFQEDVTQTTVDSSAAVA